MAEIYKWGWQLKPPQKEAISWPTSRLEHKPFYQYLSETQGFKLFVTDYGVFPVIAMSEELTPAQEAEIELAHSMAPFVQSLLRLREMPWYQQFPLRIPRTISLEQEPPNLQVSPH